MKFEPSQEDKLDMIVAAIKTHAIILESMAKLLSNLGELTAQSADTNMRVARELAAYVEADGR